jgi:hypothetical protein
MGAELLALVGGGAWVEPGPLSVRVECVPRRLLSAQALTPLLGEGLVRQLQEVGPTPFRHLVVSGAPDWAGKSSPDRTILKYSYRRV